MIETLSQLIAEDEVYERFPGLFKEGELRQARKDEAIAFYPRGRSIYYIEADLVAYIQSQRVDPCQQNHPLDRNREVPRDSSSSEITGSAASVTHLRSTATGMTPALEERAARRLDSAT